MEFSEIVYIKEPGPSNTVPILEQAKKRLKALDIEYAVIAASTGHTVKNFMKIFYGVKVDIIVASMEKGSKMPVTFLYKKYKKSKEIRDGFLKKGMKYFPNSLSDETVAEFEKKGIRIFFVPDILGIGAAMSPDDEKRRIKTNLDSFLPKHLRPLDIEAGTDLSLLNIISKGFRVCVGITTLAAKNGLVPKGKMVLSVAGTGWAGGGADTAVIIQSNPNPKKCYVKEIIGFPEMK
jgi:hypothetical protein